MNKIESIRLSDMMSSLDTDFSTTENRSKGGLKISHCDKNIERANQIRLINQKISAQSLASVQSAKTVMFEEQKLELANLDDFS